MSSLFALPNNTFTETYDEFSLSNEQIQAGKQIINCFTENNSNERWVVLLSQMQSGKTETYLFVCCEMLRMAIINTVVIFSGNAETDLREQLKKEATGMGNSIFYGKYELYLEEVLTIQTRVRREILSNIKKNITVLWGTDLVRHNKIYNNTLFIWEEAHYAQTINQCPDKFLKTVGISADGNVESLIQTDNYVVSISATPFSEISDIYNLKQSKRIIYMHPGTGYNSVKHILTSGRLKPFKSIESGLMSALTTPHHSPKYAIIRITNKNEKNILHIIKEYNWNHIIYDSISSKEDILLGKKTWDEMNVAPKQDTVIIIRGKCRMGKNLEKQHILFVMETSKKSNTDTVLQGLLGRVCGYSKGSDMIDVYLHHKIVSSGEINRYIDLTEGHQIIPVNACNISKTIITYNKHPIIPFLVSNINISDNSRRQIFRKIQTEISNPNFDFGRTDPSQFNEIKCKILTMTNMENIVIHDVIGNKKKRFTIVSQTIKHFRETSDELPIKLWHTGIEIIKENGTLPEGRIINIFYYKENDPEFEIEAGSVYIYGVTETKNPAYIVKNNIPKTTGREVFANRLENCEEYVANGGFVINMPLDTSYCLTSMKNWILDFIELTVIFPDSRSVNSQWDNKDKMYKGIVMNSSVETALLPGGEIYREAINQFGAELNLTKSLTCIDIRIAKMGFTRYESINWTLIDNSY